MAQNHIELYFEHLKGQAQFAYFQLGLVASAIAFTVHETANQSLEDTPWPVGAAVALWAISFAVGCLGLGARQRGMGANVRYIEFTRAASSFSHEGEITAALSKAKQDVEAAVERPQTLFRWQLGSLFAGALCFIAGHIMQMAALPSADSLRTGKTQCTTRMT